MRYYLRANTSQGVWDFTEDNVLDVETIINLKCGNINITDAIISEFCSVLTEGYDEIIAPVSKILKSGIILKNRRCAVVNNFASATESINIDNHLSLWHGKETDMPDQMYIAYKEAKKIHDEWEKIYISNMDFAGLDKFCKNIISLLAEGKSNIGQGKIYKRFFGTTTVYGTTNVIDSLTKKLPKRYFIKGRPGTGKSTFLKKLSAALTEKGFDIEQYYCSFDPHSLDMVVSRELGFCVFDSTPPHEKFPERDGDVILDFYKESGLIGTDEKCARELAELKADYDDKIKEGNRVLKEVYGLRTEENIKEFAKVPRSEILYLANELKNFVCE